MARSNVFGVALAVAWTATWLSAQTAAPAADAGTQLTGFRLGAGDVIQIHAVDAEDISDKPIRIGTDGYVNLPIVGRVKVSEHTVEEVQTDLANRLKRLIVNPDVTVSVVETHGRPISVVGAVRNPGVFELQGKKTLLEAMSLAGGPRDDAGYMARITRQKEFGPIPLPNASADPSGEFIVAQLNLQKIMEARDPAGNILMMPNDVISVSKADMVYVIGDVLKAGGIALGDQKTVTVLQAISIASGLGKTAKSTEAKILRLIPGSTSRTEVPVNLKTILAGKTTDIPMQPEDILFVPTSLKKDVGLRTLEALGGGSMTVISRIP